MRLAGRCRRWRRRPGCAVAWYQLWVVTAEAPISAGLLTVDDAGRGVGLFDTPPDIAPVAVGVTDEPAGRVPTPTGAMYLVGKPIAG